MAVNRYYSSIAVDTVLTTGISGSDTQIVLAATTGYPTSYPFTLALDYDTSAEELVNVVGIGSLSNSYIVGTSVGVASVTGRGVDGTTAQSHNASAVVKHVISARDMREAQEHIAASTSVHGISNTADLATKTGTETLTNKTLTAPAIAGGTISSAAISGGSITGPTVTNPTITGGSVTGATGTNLALVGGSITGAAMTNGSITGAAITGGSITGSVSGNPTFTGTVTLPASTTGATGAVTTNMIADAAITTAKIADGAIVNADINASAAITPSKIAGTAIVANDTSYLNPVGAITMWPTGTAPSGWQLCDGSIASSAALQTVLGTTNVPDMRGYAPVGYKSGDADFGTLKGTAGAKTVTLAKGNLPAHVHTINHDHSLANIWYNSGGAANIAAGSSTNRATAASVGAFSGNSGDATADGLKSSPDAVANIQPSFVINFIIKY